MSDPFTVGSLPFNQRWLEKELPRCMQLDGQSHSGAVGITILFKKVSLKRHRGLFLYELQFEDEQHRSCRQMYTGHVVPPGRLQREYRHLKKRARHRPAIGEAAGIIDEANLILLAYPNARKMHLAREDWLHYWLAGHLPELVNELPRAGAWELRETRVDVLRYIPDKRLTARCRVTFACTGRQKESTFILKQFQKPEMAGVLYHNLDTVGRAMTSAIGASERRSPGRLPAALCLEDNMGIVFIENVSGRSLVEALSEINLKSVVSDVGKVLAHFHSTRIKVAETISTSREIIKVERAIEIIVKKIPDLRVRLCSILARLQVLRLAAGGPSVLLHGSFAPHHLILHNDGVVPIDLDGLRGGPPAFDLANFISCLYSMEGRGRIDRTQRRKSMRYFLQGYSARVTWPVSGISIMWFMVTDLIHQRVLKDIMYLKTNLLEKINRGLTLTESLLARCEKASESGPESVWRALP